MAQICPFILRKTGHVFLPDIFATIELIIDNRYMVATKGINYVIVNISTGQILNSFESTNYVIKDVPQVCNFSENLRGFFFFYANHHGFRITNKYLIYNTLKHEWVNMPTLFKDIGTTLYGTLKLTTYNNENIYLNKSGEQIPFSEKDSMQIVYHYNQQYQTVGNPKKEYALIAENQQLIFPWDSAVIHYFAINDKNNQELYYALRGQELFCIDTKEKTTLAYDIQDIMRCNNQYIWAKYQEKWGLFDVLYTKDWIISPRFEEVEGTNDYDRFPVVQNGKRYIVDTKYQIIADELSKY